jgi:hypothetical protein
MKQIQKVHKYGEKFDSKLELYFYELLHNSDIPFEFQVCYELIPSFKYDGKSIRAMTLTVDFDFTEHGLNVVVDTKGFWRNDNKLKWKMFQWCNEMQPKLFFPKSQKECIEVVQLIKNMKK